MFPEWTWIVGLMLGATIGSFLNVVIYRMPRNLSLANPPNSFCPKCRHPLGMADLVPLFSWLTSKGNCRHCGAPVPVRYFLVELLNGALWAVIWWQFFIASDQWIKGIAFAITTAILVAIIFIDWELYIIPDELNFALLVVGVGYHSITRDLTVALTGALLGWGLLWGIALLGRLLFGKDAMGHGDIKMMRGVGAVIGPLLLGASLAIAVVAGLVIGVTLIAIQSRKAKAESVAEATEEEEFLEPESIGSLFLFGAWYLFCLDCVGVLFPQIYRWIGQDPSPESIDDDDWKPSLTTIPFGPYLAIGSIVCMLFTGWVESSIRGYWEGVTGESRQANQGIQLVEYNEKSGRLGLPVRDLLAGGSLCRELPATTTFDRGAGNNQQDTSVLFFGRHWSNA